MKILAVAGGEKSANALEALIDEKGEHSVTPSIGASTARRMVLDEEWDTVIINYPLSDEPGALAQKRMQHIHVAGVAADLRLLYHGHRTTKFHPLNPCIDKKYN